MHARSLHLTLLLIVSMVLSSACASEYTVLDRATLQASEPSRLTAHNLLPTSTNAKTREQLAVAQEVYQRQLSLLKERRNKARSRRRTLNTLSFATLTATTLAVGTLAVLSDDSPNANSRDSLQDAGLISLSGTAVGTTLQLAGALQEDSSAIDAKIQRLDLLYDTLITQLRTLSFQLNASSPPNEAARITSDMSALIEMFISEALSIHIKG